MIPTRLRLALVPLAAALVAVTLCSACGSSVPVGQGYALMADIQTEPSRKLDVLFVIDNSGSMFDEESELADRFRDFIDTLSSRMGEMPSIHIGVVSTDMGTGMYPVGTRGSPGACDATGDKGLLLSVPTSDGCPTPDGHFIIDEGGSTQSGNYPPGELAETFACIAHLPPYGCGFEQPFEAMRTALTTDDPTNAGFLRPDAMLLVVLVTDEDDCSAADDSLFDSSQSELDDPLGQYGSFRCFDLAVTCAEDNRTIGAKTDCQVNDASPYLFPVQRYVDFLTQLKGGDPGMVLVAAMSGENGPVEVIQDPMAGRGALRVASTCSDGSNDARPALRVHDLLGQMPRHVFSSICDPATAGDMTGMAGAAGAAMVAPQCLLSTPLDTDPDADGIQAACRATLIDGAERTRLASCAGSSSGPCFDVAPDRGTCVDTVHHLGVAVQGVTPGPGRRIEVECLSAD